MNRKIKNRRAFAAVTLSTLILLACFSGAAFADSETTKEAVVPVEFNIKVPQLSFYITEEITATSDGKTSAITYSNLVVENTGATKITVSKLAFTPNSATSANGTQLQLLSNKSENDFANMEADSNKFSLVAKYNNNEHDFGESDALEYAINAQLAKKGGKLTVEFEGQTAPYTQDFNDSLGSFVVTVSR